MRVPRGFPWLLMRTAAFSSNRMYEPSGRPYSLAVRTTTARTTSPFLTAAFGMACLTLATMTSPTPAVVLSDRPMTRMHWMVRAPVLSATLRRDWGWIMRRSRTPRWLRRPPTPRPRRLRRPRRPGLLDEHGVPDVGLVGLVVGLELGGQADDPLVQPVACQAFDGHDDRLVH